MLNIPFDEAVSLALDSLLSDRFVLLIGAGLSMAPPSSLPSAESIAATAKKKYDAIYGNAREPLSRDVAEQAEFFLQRGELSSVYFNNLIDKNAFASPPNAGHYAVADILLVRGARWAVTTNVDSLIETAGAHLYGQIEARVDGALLNLLPAHVSPLLKVHGCRNIDPPNMVWAFGQLNEEPVLSRVESSKAWLSVQLHGRDLIIVGYWSDWDYLNSVLERTLGTVVPANVLVVNPAAPDTFEAKAPQLYALGNRASAQFRHVQASGSDFLADVRRKFSETFLRRVCYEGAVLFEEETGAPPGPDLTEPPLLDNETLWQMRRDLEGCYPNAPASLRDPPQDLLLGLTLLRLRACGAICEGPYWRIKGVLVRVIRAPNAPLHRLEAAFERETPPAVAADVVVAVGAEKTGLAPNIVRGRAQATIARGSKSRWLTRQEADQELL